MMIIITQKTSNRASNNAYQYLQQVDPAKEYTTRTINDNKGIYYVKRHTEKKGLAKNYEAEEWDKECSAILCLENK